MIRNYKDTQFQKEALDRLYSRTFTAQTSDGQQIKEFLLPKRSSQVTEDDVLEYLSTIAKRVFDVVAIATTDQEASYVVRDQLEALVHQLPERIKLDLRSGNRELEEMIRQSTPAIKLREGEKKEDYLYALVGILPVGFLDENRENIAKYGLEFYDQALNNDEIRKHGLGKKLLMRLTIEKDGSLPGPRDKIVGYFKDQVSVSKPLFIEQKRYDEDLARDVYDFLMNNYCTQKSRENLSVDEHDLIEASTIPILSLLESVKEARKQQQQMMKFGELFKGL
jgi:hypothetical protein